MKKKYLLVILAILFFFSFQAVSAQTPVCGGTFTDPGGATGNYTNNSDHTVTIYPTNPGEYVKVTFTAFNTEATHDGLYVFDGNSITAPQIASSNGASSVPGGLPGAFWGTSIPGPFKSSSPDGSLTFRFRSDVSATGTGWIANVTCETTPGCNAVPNNFNVTGTTTTSATINWNATTGGSQWEVLILPNTSTPPNSETSGNSVSTTSFTATGLTCGAAYTAYIRSVCSTTNISHWVRASTFQTSSCTTNPTPQSTCLGANSLCGALGSVFANTTGMGQQGTIGCLLTTPNGTWFNFSVNNPGTVNLQIIQNSNFDTNANPIGNPLDVDYVLFGPYAAPVTSCSTQLTADKIVSCSYSANYIENPSFTATQTEGYYYMMVTNYSNNPGFIKISQTGGTGTLDCSGFRLNAFLDTNTNGIKDSGELAFPHGQFVYEKNNDGIVHNSVSSNGMVNIFESNNTNSYDFAYQINPEHAVYYTLATPTHNDITLTGTGMTDINFPIQVAQPLNDMTVNVSAIGQPRPGFTYKNRIVYTNNGNQISNGKISFAKDTPLTISAISQSGTVATGNGFTYDFTNLNPFETRTIEVTMQVPTIPTVQLGQLLHNSASVSILPTVDAIANNNNFELTQAVIGSYDPNDVTESHGEEIIHSTFGSNDYLYYTIRFENTGSASAINVKVNNVLNAKLDESTLKMIGSSHNFVMDRVGVNVNWDFKNIMLAATSQNPNASKGYIIYRIKPKPGYAVGDIIPNTASIYFDFNPAIVTNTFHTEFISQLGVNEFENAILSCYPNPAKDLLMVAIKNSTASISDIMVFDLTGKIILNKSTPQGSTSETLDLSGTAKGMYLIEITTTSNHKTVKKLLIE